MGLRSWLRTDDIEIRRSWPWSELENTVALSNPLSNWPTTGMSATELAMAVPTAYRCIEILTTQTAQFKVQAWRGDMVLPDQPRLLRRPDPFSDYFTFLAATVFDMLAEGTAAWLTTARAPDGTVTAIQHLPAKDLEIRWDPNMNVARARLEQAREIKYGGVVLNPADVNLIPMLLAPGEACGVGPVQAGRPINQGQVDADAMVRSNFTDGVFPSGSVEVPSNLSEEQATKIKRRFVERHGGSREPVVLTGGAVFKPHAVTARDSQWIEARQWGAAEVARLFGVPPAALNIPIVGGSQVTYNNAVSVRTDLLHTGLSPIIARLEAAWSRYLPSTQDAHIDTTNYLPPLEAIVPSAADPNRPPADTSQTPQPTMDPSNGNTAVV